MTLISILDQKSNVLTHTTMTQLDVEAIITKIPTPTLLLTSKGHIACINDAAISTKLFANYLDGTEKRIQDLFPDLGTDDFLSLNNRKITVNPKDNLTEIQKIAFSFHPITTQTNDLCIVYLETKKPESQLEQILKTRVRSRPHTPDNRRSPIQKSNRSFSSDLVETLDKAKSQESLTIPAFGSKRFENFLKTTRTELRNSDLPAYTRGAEEVQRSDSPFDPKEQALITMTQLFCTTIHGFRNAMCPIMNKLEELTKNAENPATVQQLAEELTKSLKELEQIISKPIETDHSPKNTNLEITNPISITILPAEYEKDLFKILIAEDNIINFKILKQTLIQLGFKADNITHALDGEKAVEMFLGNDLIIMDIHMPHMNGDEAAEKILATAKIPIIAYTGGQKEEYNHEIFTENLIKPVTSAMLNSVLNTHFKFKE